MPRLCSWRHDQSGRKAPPTTKPKQASGNATHRDSKQPIMKTTHEVLQEITTARLRSNEADRKWAKLRRDCQSPAVLGYTWLGFLVIVVLLVWPTLKDLPPHWIDLPLGLLTTLMIAATGVVTAFRKRQKAMLEIIATEAPQLLQRLKDENIA